MTTAKAWTWSKKPSKASAAHVEISQQTFGGFADEWTFWSLAPASAFDRFAKRVKLASPTAEYVWLVKDQVVVAAVVDTETSLILTGNRSVNYHQEVAA